MRDQSELDNARSIVTEHLANSAFSKDQRLLFQGMSVALQWAAGKQDGTLGRLVGGEKLAVGRSGEVLAAYTKTNEVLVALYLCHECLVHGGSTAEARAAFRS